MSIRPTDQKLRNKIAREQIVYVVHEYGLRWNYVARKMDMQQSNVSHWRKERFEFGALKLRQIENFIDYYLNQSA